MTKTNKITENRARKYETKKEEKIILTKAHFSLVIKEKKQKEKRKNLRLKKKKIQVFVVR